MDATELIFTMRECGPELMDEAADKAAKAKEPLELLGRKDDGLVECCIVKSGGKFYHVWRFGTWYRCECRDFDFSRSACKHIYFVSPFVCRVCLGNPVDVKGTVCASCQFDARRDEHLNAPYLKNTEPKNTDRPRMIGRIRV